jgi:hypothetical protein
MNHPPKKMLPPKSASLSEARGAISLVRIGVDEFAVGDLAKARVEKERLALEPTTGN